MKTLIIENVIIGLFYFVIGILVYKYPNLIAGYNTASSKEREGFDIMTFKKKLRNGFFVIGFLSMLLGILSFFYSNEILVISLMIALPVLFSIWVLIQSGRCRSKESVSKGRQSLIVCIIVVSVIVMFAVICLLGTHSSEKIRIGDDALTIEGSFGTTVMYDGISNMELCDTLPAIQLRTFGSAVNGDLRGKFKVKEIGDCRLYVRVTDPPFIKIWCTDGEIIFINRTERDSTLKLYHHIQQHVLDN